MIIKTYINRNLYGKYFLATEAPDDEEVTEEQPKPKRNVKVISVKPSNRGKDFSQIEEEPVEEPTPEETPETTESTPETEETVPAEDTSTEPTENVPEETEVPDAEEAPVEDVSDTGDEDFTDGAEDTGEEVNTDDTGETGEETPDDSGDEDFTAGVDDTGEEATPTEETPPTENTTASSDNTANNNNAPGVDLDSMRRYNLFKEFMSLYNACDNYISKLENILRNDYEENQIIRISVNNLREIKDILSDYMTIRFRLNSYIQSLLFYQKMVVSVQLVFNMLKSINSKNSKVK